MAKTTTKLNAQDRVILFCAATGIEHVAVGILAHAMQSMAVRGFIKHDRESGAYALTDSGRAVLSAIGRYSRRAKHILRLIGCQAAHPSFFIGRLFEISPKQPWCVGGIFGEDRLVAGVSGYICDQCVTKCVAVLEQHGGFAPTVPSRWSKAG